MPDPLHVGLQDLTPIAPEASPYGIEAADGRFLRPGGRNWCTVPMTNPDDTADQGDPRRAQ
jgi:hypothetical protein